MPRPRSYASHAARQAAYRRRQQQARAAELRAKGLPPLPAIPSMPGDARWRQALAHAQLLLSSVLDEMQAYFDDRSETWQEGDRGATFQERIDAVQECVDAVEAAQP